MPIYEGSRYENAQVIRVKDAEGVSNPALYSMVGADISAQSFTTYVVAEGDRYDLIAARLLGDPQLWWVFADLNPEYLHPDPLPSGAIIRVPVV